MDNNTGNYTDPKASEASFGILKEELFSQTEVYERLRKGDNASVCYAKAHNKDRGTYDANYVNRSRLAHYFLYANTGDEETIAYLFKEELKDRQTNSFQGIGSSLMVLTMLLQTYNESDQYADLFDSAKNANFDCACGYDPDETIDTCLDELTLIDCIYLAYELEYQKSLRVLIDEWKSGITEWTEANIQTAVRFNKLLGKDEDNELNYIALLNEAMKKEKNFDRVAAYTHLIQFYIDTRQFEQGYQYLYKMIETIDISELGKIRLRSTVLEQCFELVCGLSEPPMDLWNWGKSELEQTSNMFGNLYVKAIGAAKKMSDPIALHLEKSYEEWKKEVGIK